MLERTAVAIDPQWVEARLQVGLPAAGRRVLGDEAEALLCDELPRIVEEGLLWERLPRERATHFVLCVENQERIREQLPDRGLVAFVADASILPSRERRQRPTDGRGGGAIPRSGIPARELRASQSHRFAGPGLHPDLGTGNSPRCDADRRRGLSRKVDPAARARARRPSPRPRRRQRARRHRARRGEDPGRGRPPRRGLDISSFIDDLPQGRSTRSFASDDASGSTSQAANIVEALEIGATTLLLDEDTSATNFMVRDARMQALVHEDHEPITPFVDRVASSTSAWASPRCWSWAAAATTSTWPIP